MSDARLLSIPLSAPGELAWQAESITMLLPQHPRSLISELDIAFRKELLVTCGKDHAIRVCSLLRRSTSIGLIPSQRVLHHRRVPRKSQLQGHNYHWLQHSWRIYDPKLQRIALLPRGAVLHMRNRLQRPNLLRVHIKEHRQSPFPRGVMTIAWSTDENVLGAYEAEGDERGKEELSLPIDRQEERVNIEDSNISHPGKQSKNF
jgi:hypothetical protein